MTTTSDASCGDKPTDMAIDNGHTSSPTPTASTETSSDEFRTLKLKFEFRVTSDDFVPHEVHRQIMFAIANTYDGTLFYNNIDDNNDCFDPFTASEDSMETSYNYKNFKRSNHDLCCFAHSIATFATFENVKDTIKHILQEYNGFIRINKWLEKDLDIATAGWIFESNPTIHNRDYLNKIIKSYCEASDETFNPIELQSKTISFTNRHTKARVKSEAIHILCRRDDVKKTQQMMQTLYSDKNFPGPGKFIPIDIVSKQNSTTLEKLIHLQKSYIENHRSVTIIGVSLESLNQPIRTDSNDTLFDIVDRCPWIDWLSPTTKTPQTGRIIFSTTTQKYYSAIDWIETKFLTSHQNIPNRIDPIESGGKAYRLIRKGQSNTTTDEYSTNLAKTISSISIPNQPTPNAWSKPLVIGESNPTISTMTKNTYLNSNQQSTSDTADSLNAKIDNLSQTIEKLQLQLTNQAEQQTKLLSTIQTLVEDTISKRFETIQHEVDTIKDKYIAITEQINETWSQKYKRLQQTILATKNDAPGSGSNRARKQPRTVSNLTSVQRNLFQSTLNLSKKSNDDNKDSTEQTNTNESTK